MNNQEVIFKSVIFKGQSRKSAIEKDESGKKPTKAVSAYIFYQNEVVPQLK